MKNDVVFSILITVFNRQDLLNRQLDYIFKDLDGIDLNFEIVVYDDFSVIPLFLEEKFSSNSSIRLVRGESNVGLIEARNRLVRLSSSSSKYLLFVDDDIFIFNFLKAVKFAIEQLNSGYSIVSLPYLNLPTEYRGGLAWFRYILDFRQGGASVVFFNGGASFFSKETFTKFGFLEGRYIFYLEEEDFALRVTSGGGKILYAYDKSFVAIHDQPRGKVADIRHMLRLSNRFLFHRKFFNPLLAFLANLIYSVFYIFKLRAFGVVWDAWVRYLLISPQFSREPISFLKVCNFCVRRYFNIWL